MWWRVQGFSYEWMGDKRDDKNVSSGEIKDQETKYTASN